ncbi:hypothetical protein [Paractinoplanes toevensis]|uniref:Lipoprotein n=1 Tax=Paractinoplanes toevensis TaxID=571911 RepID=A0A919WB52_9ACTN|nr:hypothetical protein [Actinoplanes toevensis]GIM96967.1 hypothetical protein Ato02nite_087600 [Actinoplanes toevensis]
MRTRTVAALALMSALVAAGCGRAASNDPQVASAQTGTATPSSSASASASDDPDAPVKFSRCMRDHGITWFPDPSGGKLAVAEPPGVDRSKVEAAQKACKQYMPNGGEAPKPSAEDLEKVRAQAKCMRENGVPNFPDPEPDGRLAIDGSKLGTGPGDPTFDKAEKACAKYLPEGAEKHTEQHTSGGGTDGGPATEKRVG